MIGGENVMALIKCPECNNEISDSINNCIYCGYKINNNSNKTSIVKIILVVIALLIFGMIMYKNINNKKATNPSNQENDTITSNDNLEKCSNSAYFISLLQGEIYARENWDATINITKCNHFRHTNDSISVSCSYTRTWNSVKVIEGTTTKPRVDKLSHSKVFSCKD